MHSLKFILERMKSIKSIRRVSEIIKLISASKLIEAQGCLESSSISEKHAASVLNSLMNQYLLDLPLCIGGSPASRQKLCLVITSDRGLCGSFNSKVIKLANSAINKLCQEGNTVQLLCLGQKGYDYFYKRYPNQIVHYEKTKEITYQRALSISQVIKTHIHDISECIVYFNNFKNTMCYTQEESLLLPIKKDNSHDSAAFKYDADKMQLLKTLAFKKLSLSLYHLLIKNAASEHSARMVAMDAAVKNADKIIKKLTLQYNRSRQAAITKDITEIISGAEAL